MTISFLSFKYAQSSAAFVIDKISLACMISVILSIDRAPVIRKIFVYRRKLGDAEEVCTRRRRARGWWATVRFTDSDKWIRRSIIPRPKCISRHYDRMDVCSYRPCPISNSSAGFSMLSGLTSQMIRVAPILRDHYARYLLSPTVRK